MDNSASGMLDSSACYVIAPEDALSVFGQAFRFNCNGEGTGGVLQYW